MVLDNFKPVSEGLWRGARTTCAANVNSLANRVQMLLDFPHKSGVSCVMFGSSTWTSCRFQSEIRFCPIWFGLDCSSANISSNLAYSQSGGKNYFACSSIVFFCSWIICPWCIHISCTWAANFQCCATYIDCAWHWANCSSITLYAMLPFTIIPRSQIDSRSSPDPWVTWTWVSCNSDITTNHSYLWRPAVVVDLRGIPVSSITTINSTSSSFGVVATAGACPPGEAIPTQ